MENRQARNYSACSKGGHHGHGNRKFSDPRRAFHGELEGRVSWRYRLTGYHTNPAGVRHRGGLFCGFAVGKHRHLRNTFTLAAGVYLIVVAMLSSTIGGYIAGRMRSQWQTVHEHERYFRDTAHGFLVWALATVVSAAVLGGATTNLLSGASAGLAPAASSAGQASPNAVYIDSLLRKDPTAASASTTTPAMAAPANSGSDMNVNRGEIARIITPSLRSQNRC
jgi:hypothetical protein